ncbi:MAG: FtsW/RodA/SpoVE family cell cycle protein [Lachnospiraceae bacterium]|nr:FtsW/RodA/SpoVE family cell cycle protein [Lachnospiraceae bacterium]
MPALIMEVSKYLFVILMALYVALAFFSLRRREDDFRRGIYYGMEILALSFYGLGIFNLLSQMVEHDETDKIRELGILAGVEFAVLLLLPIILRIIYRDINNQLLCQMQMLLGIGFLMLARLNIAHAKRQFLIIGVSLAISLFVPFLLRKFDFWKKLTWIYGGVGIAALLIVLLHGNLINGSKLNYKVFGLIFQPSEAVKLLFAFFIAGLLAESFRLKNILVSAALAAVHVLILVASKDLGSALIFFVMYVAMVYVASGKHRYFLAGLVGGLLAAVFAWMLFAHVRTRVQIWLDPFSDPDNKGYQLTQSLFGIATGGWFGLGFGHGAPKIIPFVEADFIFSAVTEEFGVLVGILLILLCLGVVLSGLVQASRIRDPFYRIVTVGLVVCYGTQVFLTIGGGTGFIPLTGVTLPLISNGGTSALVTVILFSILQGIHLMRMDEFDEESLEQEEYEEKLAVWDEHRERLLDEGYSEEEIEDSEADFFAEEDEREEEREPLREHQKKQSRCIFVNGLLYSFLYLFMFVNIVCFVIKNGDEAMVNPYNSKRMAILEQDNRRGTIYAQDGTVLAESSVAADGTETRNYPFGASFAHVVGYSVNGGLGVERQMQKYLITSDISLGDKMQNGLMRMKNPGNNVYTTLDPDLQKLAYESMGNYRGAVVVSEAGSGKILAMVSKPAFDPNDVVAIWDDLLADEETGRLVNRSSQGQYPPGSTFKIITALEYIRENPQDYKDYRFECSGHFSKDGGSIQCYHGTVHGDVDLTESFAGSCNSSFANIGTLLDRSRFGETLLGLHFNEDLGLQLESNPSRISMRSDLSTEDVMQTAIGQSETLMSPLHLNMITLAIANGGEMMKPYVIDRVTTADGAVIKRYEPVSMGTVLSASENAVMKDLMAAVVDHGTGKRLKQLPFSSAGKTGSAEFSLNKQQSHAWYTGFAPLEDPKVVVTVILENAGSGGEMAAPVAGALFSAYMEKHPEGQ